MSEEISRYKKALSIVMGVRHAYVNIFKGNNGDRVLKDLARFCKYGDSTYSKEPMDMARYEGRKETFLRIVNFLNLSDEELTKIITGLKKGE